MSRVNLPYSRSAITNLAKKIFHGLDQLFPPLGTSSNGNNVKVSYCSTQNVKNIIRSHNKKMINCSNHHALLHNCVEKQKFVHWSENAKLKLKFVNVFPTSSHPDKAYLGTPKVYFKNRFYKHIRLNNSN